MAKRPDPWDTSEESKPAESLIKENLVETPVKASVETPVETPAKVHVKKVEGMTLCTLSDKAERPKDGSYSIGTRIDTFTFKGPDYQCLLPDELADEYDKTKHLIVKA
jgi:hypothetical protein